MGEEDVEHVTFPGAPRAMLVVAHAQIGLVFEKTLLDGPAKGRDDAERFKRGGLRSVREGELRFSFGSFEKDEPFGPGGGVFELGDGKDAQGAEGDSQRALGSFLEDQGGEGRRLGDLGHGPRIFGEAELGGGGTLGMFPFRNLPCGRLHEDAGGASDGGEVAEIRGEGVQKLLVGAVGGVAADPSGGEAPLLVERSDHFGRDLGLGLEHEILGNAGLLPAFLEFFRLGEPLLGHVETGVEKSVAPGAGIAHEDARLAVLDLSEPTAILTGHPDRLLPLFDKGSVVGGEHGQGGFLRGPGGELGGELLLVEMVQGVLVPVAAAHETLEAPNADVHRQGDRLDALSDEIAAQSGQIDDAQGPDPPVPEDAGVGLVEATQLKGDPGNVLRSQGLSVRERSGIGRPPGQVRALRGRRLVFAAQSHDRAKGGIQNLNIDLFALPVVVIAGLGLAKSRRAAQAEESGRLVAGSGKVRGVHEGLHDPETDPEALLPVPERRARVLPRTAEARFLTLTPGKIRKRLFETIRER